VARTSLSLKRLTDSFPRKQHPALRPAQQQAFELIARNPGSLTLELPTGSGKTAIGYTYLRALANVAPGPLFYIVPNKTLVDTVHKLFPDTTVAYGRSEYDCLYYGEETGYRADEIPCLSLTDCEHRVDQTTGLTILNEPGVKRCPYYDAKFETTQGKIVVCTTAFFLYNRLFARNPVPLGGLVIDEAHRIASTFRSALSYDITDWHLRRAVQLLTKIGADEHADTVDAFLQTMVRILRRKPQNTATLLDQEELEELVAILRRIDANDIQRRLGEALQRGTIDPAAERTTLKQLETVAFNLRRYVTSLEYALPGEYRAPLNYVTYAYSYVRPQGQERVQHRLIVRAYYVAPLVRKLLSPHTLAYSATIGNPDVFAFETGIQTPFFAVSSGFPAENTGIFLPSDTPNLATRYRPKAEPTKVLRRVAKACLRFRKAGHRSLMVVISDTERQKFQELCHEEGVAVISYDADSSPREAMARFKAGEGDVLVGTSANYGEGVDLPDGLAPVTFFLRPGYPSPADPATQFEQHRFGQGQSWAVWNWRVMIEALQVRGRNVRSANDRGVTIFVSQQFGQFVYGSLPEWLKPSYRRGLSLDECCDQALEVLGTRA